MFTFMLPFFISMPGSTLAVCVRVLYFPRSMLNFPLVFYMERCTMYTRIEARLLCAIAAKAFSWLDIFCWFASWYVNFTYTSIFHVWMEHEYILWSHCSFMIGENILHFTQWFWICFVRCGVSSIDSALFSYNIHVIRSY